MVNPIREPHCPAKIVVADFIEKLDNNAGLNVQFTSNFEDYMHRDTGGLFKDLPLYIYNMWVYACRKPSGKDPLAEFMLQLDFHASYGGPSRIRVQRLVACRGYRNRKESTYHLQTLVHTSCHSSSSFCSSLFLQ